MVSDAQSKATNEYRKRSVKQVVVRFYPKEHDLHSWVKDHGGSTYLKRLAETDRDSSERRDDL